MSVGAPRRRPVPVLHGVPRVSVVVPCHRYGHLVGAAVDSVLAQDGVDVEVVVVDDASPDGSGEVVRGLAATHDRVRAVLHPTNRGHLATYDHGLGLATADHVLLLSADDVLAPGALARALAVVQAHPQVGLVHGFAPDFDGEPPAPPEPAVARRGSRPRASYALWTGGRWLDRVCRSGQNPVCTPTALVRRDLLEAVGGYDATLPHTADLLLWLQLAARADVAYVSGAPQAFYRVHGANMHTTDFAAADQDRAERARAFEVLGQQVGGPTGQRLVAHARRALVREAQRTARAGRAARLTEDLRGRVDFHHWRLTGQRL